MQNSQALFPRRKEKVKTAERDSDYSSGGGTPVGSHTPKSSLVSDISTLKLLQKMEVQGKQTTTKLTKSFPGKNENPCVNVFTSII